MSDEYAPDYKELLEQWAARENEPDEVEPPLEEEPPLGPPEGWEQATANRSGRIAAILAEVDEILGRARSAQPMTLDQIQADTRRAIALCAEVEGILGGGEK